MPTWRDRATAVQQPSSNDTWRQRATPADLGYTQKLQQGAQNRTQQMQQAADAFVAGEQSLPETAIQQGLAFASNVPDVLATTAEQVTPEIVKEGLGTITDVGTYLAGQTIGRLPVPGREGNLAEELPRDIQTVTEGDTRTARNVRAAGQALNLGGTGKALSATGNVVASRPVVQRFLKDTSTTGAVQAKRSAAKQAAKANIIGMDEIDNLAKEAYQQADEIGATFNPNQVADKFETKLSESMPKALPSGKMTSEAKELAGHLDELAGNKGRSLTLNQVQDLDEALTQKINKMVDAKTGDLDANGRKLYLLQNELRDIVDTTDVAGNNALINGRKLWQARSMIRDLDAIAERASLSKNPHSVMQTGYKNLFLNKKRIRGWPDEAKELLEKAANPNAGTEILDLVASRLPAIIMGGTGNLPGAATANVLGVAARGAKEAVTAKRGARVQQSIVEDTLAGLRKVEVPTPEPVAQRLLSSPENISRLPMTDKEIGISQALLNRGNINKATVEGGPISPTPQRLLGGPKPIIVDAKGNVVAQ